MGTARWLLLLYFLLPLFSCHGEVVVVRVDLENGDDSSCLSALDLSSPSSSGEGARQGTPPCETINAALYGNSSFKEIRSNNCSTFPHGFLDVRVLLADGTHRLRERLALVKATNLTIAAEHPGRASIGCTDYPNLVQGNFDNVYICLSQGLRFVGVVFEKCGPVPSNMFVYNSSDITIDNCIFRDNTGPSLQVRFSTGLSVIHSTFENNINKQTPPQSDLDIEIDELYNTVQTSGGITLFSQTDPTDMLIQNCRFINNQASRNAPNNTRPVLLKQNGHGGALLVRLSGTVGGKITIVDSHFESNFAEVDGGAIYISISDRASTNQFIFSNITFSDNRIEDASGGAVSLNSFNFTHNNSFHLSDCVFRSNRGSAGGAFSVALYDSDLLSTESPDSISFERCSFVDNAAVNEGTAVGLFSLVHVDQVGFPVSFEDCLFQNNTSLQSAQDTSAVAAFRFPTTFSGNNTFISNRGGGITLLNTRMQASGTLLFEKNEAVFGGGVAMDDRCLLEISPHTKMTFQENRADESGGGIYVEFPPIRFVIDIFNRLCFLQYKDSSGDDVPPQDWEGVEIKFINNYARLSGAAIYASDMQRCGWLGNYTNPNGSLIFRPPPEIEHLSPFYYSGNELLEVSSNGTVADPQLATAPLRIHPNAAHSLVQPGEVVPISLYATDQVLNYREAVWSLEAPAQETNLDALSANQDTYFYTVPPRINLTNAGVTDTLKLNFSLLKTLGFTSSLSLTLQPSCHPGFSENNSTGRCSCQTSEENILRCDEMNRYLYLREGIWGGMNNSSTLITARVLPGYVSCNSTGRLPGCLFKFDNPNDQCREGRMGQLCGQCRVDHGVTLDLQSCSPIDCTAGLVLFILLSCIGIAIICFLVLFFDIQLPNELKAFIFYAQVIGLVYRPYAVVNFTDNRSIDWLAVLVNLLGFSVPIPLCISRTLEAQYVALLGYIPPLIIFTEIMIFYFGARYLKAFARHSAIKGITTLSLFVYKYIADTSFVFLSCVDTQLGFVFQYDGSVSCFTPFLGFFFFFGLVTVVLFVVPLPGFLMFICVKRPPKYKHYADVLTIGLKDKHSWFGGWDIARRLPFVLIAFFVVLGRPSIILFFMSIAALGVLIVQLFTKPYSQEYINIIEAAILLNLLLVTGAFLDPSNVQVPEAVRIILVVLPYIYALGFLLWVFIKYMWTKLRHRLYPAKYPKETNAQLDNEVKQPAPQAAVGEVEDKEGTLKPLTTERSTGDSSTASSNSRDTGGSQVTSLSTEKPKEPQLVQKLSHEQETAWREPLLDM